jgi:carbon-monoxide dehydrogenase medium subunit
VIPAPFEYEVAESADHAIELLGRFGEDAKLLAGGHSLLPIMKLRLSAPSALVDIGRIRELDYIRDAGDHIAIGALARHEDVHYSELLRRENPLVAHTAGEVGDPQVRHRGTIGGSIAHGDPASDLPTVMLALDASFVVRGPNGERTIGAGDFFKSFFVTDLGEQEILTEVRVPKVPGAGWSYQKFHPRAQDWAIVGVAALVEEGNGRPGRTAIAFTNMGETPLRARAVEEALGSGSDLAAAAELALDGTNPPSDAQASAEYRNHLAKVLTSRAIEEARSH